MGTRLKDGINTLTLICRPVRSKFVEIVCKTQSRPRGATPVIMIYKKEDRIKIKRLVFDEHPDEFQRDRIGKIQVIWE